MEEDMADKPSIPSAKSHKRSPADRLLTGSKENTVELDEEDLKKVSGGGALHNGTTIPK